MVPMSEGVEHDSGLDTSLVSIVETAEQRDEDGNGNVSDDYLLPGLPDTIAMQCLAWISISDYGSLASVNRRFNSLVRSGDLYHVRRQLGIVEDWIFIHFARNLVEWKAFDPKHQRWMRLPLFSEDIKYADKESLVVGSELLVFGNEFTGFAIWRYSVSTHTWSMGSPMAFPRSLFGSSSNREVAIVAGGCDNHGGVLKSAELYNSELGTWETLPEMHLARIMCAGFFMDDKFYVIGGRASNYECLTCGEEYDLQRRTWKRIPDMFSLCSVPDHAYPLVAVVNNELYGVHYSRNKVKKYNKETNSWHVLGRLPLRADSVWGLAFKAFGNELLVIGGKRGPEGEGIVFYSWQPTPEERRPEWRVLGIKENVGVLVLNCAVMSC